MTLKQYSIERGYSQKNVEDFARELHGSSERGDFTSLDFTLTTFWGDAAEKAGFASSCRYVLLEDGNPIGLFQGLVQRVLFYRSIRAGSTSGKGTVVLPEFSEDIMRLFLAKVHAQESFSDWAVFAPFSLNLSDFAEKPHYTFYIDLRLEFDEILRRMDKKTRNRVRRAEKFGVTVDFGNSLEALTKAYYVINQASEERLFMTPPWSYTLQLHRCFKQQGPGSVVALGRGKDGNIISAAHLIGYDGKIALWQAGSTVEGYKLNAGSLVQSEAIKWATAQGYLTYDLGGTNPTKNVYSGIHRFKMGFGGSLITTRLLQKRAFYVPVFSKLYRYMKVAGFKTPRSV